MALNQEFVGRTYKSDTPYEVGREKIREFAVAVGDTSELYRDRDAAIAAGYPDVIAPPTFATILAMAGTEQLMFDPELGVDYSRLVHGEQRFVYSRPLGAGDALLVTTTIESIRAAAGNDILTARGEVTTVDGEHVVTAYTTVVVRAAGDAS
jgi:acyl dehydratase